ncbi:MAG: transporter substrate-binding domain-containing protein, partial [Lachnospiraceae bacterium]|nr:transporter substrate-binding domain-containing protein [Lachnospiraceae bacterium]
MKKKFLAVVAAIGMMASLAACGGSGSTSSAAPAESAKTESAAAESTKAESTAAESTKTESTAAESVAAESTAAAGELTTVNAGKLTMSTNAAFPPYEMTTDSGDFEGIDVEVAGAIAEKLGLELQIDDMDFDAALLAAQQGKSDI